MKGIFSVLVENKAGVLSKTAGLFARRGFNIDSLAVGETDDRDISSMTIISTGDERIMEQIEKQLNKELKSNQMTREQVAAEITNVLKVAISAYDSESESFEDALQINRKNATDLLSVFQNVKLTEI